MEQFNRHFLFQFIQTISIYVLGLLEWSDSGQCVTGSLFNSNVFMNTCDPENERQMVELGVYIGGDIWPISVPQWRERMARRRNKEMGEALLEVRKVLEEIRVLNSSGELTRERGTRRAVVFFADKGTHFLAYLQWWLYAWRLLGLNTAKHAMDVVLFTHPESIKNLPPECINVKETHLLDPGAVGPGQCLYKELVPLSERNYKYDSYLNSQECLANSNASDFLMKDKILIRADLDTFPTPALIDFWPQDVIVNTYAGQNFNLKIIKDAIVDTAKAAG